jgi:hypothetical protein
VQAVSESGRASPLSCDKLSIELLLTPTGSITLPAWLSVDTLKHEQDISLEVLVVSLWGSPQSSRYANIKDVGG